MIVRRDHSARVGLAWDRSIVRGASSRLGLPRAAPRPAAGGPRASPRRGRPADDGARGLPRHPLRRRARRRQPIAFTIDPRGRLWVVENYSYPIWLGGPDGQGPHPDLRGHRRRRPVRQPQGLLGQGDEPHRASSSGSAASGSAPTPNLLFIPDRDGDDVPDGPPEVVLDGWDIKAQHNLFNALNWGPDGWLWGCNGILAELARRQARHARRRASADQLRRLALSPDPAGLRGRRPRHDQPLGPRLRRPRRGVHHQLRDPAPVPRRPRRHFQRMFGQDFNPHLYGLMETCADHIHWAGGRWPDSRERAGAKHGEAGGGHAHVGRDDLPRRQLARPLSQLASSRATSTATASTTTASSARARATSPATSPTSSWPTTPGSAAWS